MADISGRVNIPTLLVRYSGEETNTAITNVDNRHCTISVDVKTEEVTKDCATKEELNNKQDILINQENIKSINGESLLGSGDITVSVPISELSYDVTMNILTAQVILPTGTAVENNNVIFPDGVTVINHNINL